jgi:hypothetical protein
MHETGADFTNAFRALSLIDLPTTNNFQLSIERFLVNIVEQCCDADEWKAIHKSSMDERYERMHCQQQSSSFHVNMSRTFNLLKSLAGTNPALLSQFGFSAQSFEHEQMKRTKAAEFDVG